MRMLQSLINNEKKFAWYWELIEKKNKDIAEFT